jgi:hypothetical protein
MVDNLRAKLLSCGWNDEVIDLCKDSIQSKHGLENVNLEEMVSVDRYLHRTVAESCTGTYVTPVG